MQEPDRNPEDVALDAAIAAAVAIPKSRDEKIQDIRQALLSYARNHGGGHQVGQELTRKVFATARPPRKKRRHRARA